ncbi:lipopolysaccharide biosynthesis protein [Aerococcaceae bacterium WGS1372]
MKQFLKRFAGFSLGPILGALISFILFPIFTNSLSVTEYGRAGAFQTLVVQIPNFIYIGMDQAFTREYHHQKDKRDVMQQAMVLPFLLGLLMFVLSIFFAPQFSEWLFESPHYTHIIWYAGVWVLATVIERFLLLSIRMQEKSVEFSLFSLLLKIGNFIVSMAMIFIGVRDFRAVVYGLIFGQLLADVILFFRYRYLLDFSSFQLDKKLIQQMFNFGIPIMIATSLSAALNSVDTIMLREFSSLDDMAFYKAGSQIGSIIGIMKTAFASFWIPTAYRWFEEKKSMKHYKFISDGILLVLTFVFFGILALRRPLTYILSSSGEYIEVQYIMGLLAFPHIMYTLSETTTLGIVFSRKTHYNIFVSLLALVVSVAINLLLTPSCGFKGAALASTAAYVVFYLARTYFSSKTGFYFGQKKQVATMIIMIVAGLVNIFEIEYSSIYTLFFGIIAIGTQWTTLKTANDIRVNPTQWDFS